MNLCDRLFYVYSCDLDFEVQVKIGSLEGKFDKPTYDRLLGDPSLQHCVTLRWDSSYAASVSSSSSDYRPASSSSSQICQPGDLIVECEVYSDNRRVTLPVCTSYKPFTSRWNWNEWETLPIRYNELSRDARLTLTIYDFHDNLERHVVGGTSLDLFSKRGVFRQGIYDLKVWPFVVGDGFSKPSTTPGKIKPENNNKSLMPQLSKLSKKHRSGMMDKVDWLDRLTFREIELINEREKRQSNRLYLMIEFPYVHHQNIQHFIVYFEPHAEQFTFLQPRPALVTAPDPEMGLENLVEAKHHLLARSARIGAGDRELKPNAQTRDHLNAIADYPPDMELSSDEKDLIWKFRFFLQANKRALPKFVQCVNWQLANEARQSVEILNGWAPMDVDAALELLSAKFSHEFVRIYAVSRLKQVSNSDLLLYLLQLVQALKYENFRTIQAGADVTFVQEMTEGTDKTWLVDNEESTELLKKARVDPMDEAGKKLTFECELSDVTLPGSEEISGSADGVKFPNLCDQNKIPSTAFEIHANNSPQVDDGSTDLATFLISRACKDPLIANHLYWYLKVECDVCRASSPSPSATGVVDTSSTRHRRQATPSLTTTTLSMSASEAYTATMARLSRALARGGVEARRRRNQLLVQQRFVDKLAKITSAMVKESGNRKKKIEFLQHLLQEQHSDDVVNLANLECLPLPLDPTIKIHCVVPEKATVFNSANMPCKLIFKCADGTEYATIFKHGDDLRQDQLIVQIITLMDNCLRKENLDLKLTPYKVLATSVTQGFVQFIDSQPLRDVLHDWNSVQDFFRHCGPNPSGPYGIEPEILDNYVKSCAGYSVISYLLGIGDRHQHNLLLCRNGRLFHIDFGYILGRDPKPLPPPMKLTKEMVEGMGGLASCHFQEFRTLCYTGFLHLRRHANLFFNLFALMVDASIPDIAIEPDKAVKKVQERFLLHLSDEEAVRSVQQLIDDSISAKMAAFVDIMHDVAQYLRA